MFTYKDIESFRSFQINNIFRNIDCSIFDENLSFYYDETNNPISFGLNKNKDNFNDNPFADFVIAGIMSRDSKELKIEEYRERLGLPIDLCEMKSKNIFRGSFFDCLNSKKVSTFLDIVEENNIFLHFSVLNKLFYSISDIICLVRVNNVNENYYSYIPAMIAILYECIKLELPTFLTILSQFDYPNVSQNNMRDFYSKIEIILINNSKKAMNSLNGYFPGDSYNFYFGYLFSIVHMVSEGIFTAEFDTGKMIDSFAVDYYQLLFLYNRSKHQFDNIDEIKKEFEINFPRESGINYEFKDSKDSFMIQMSDVFSSIIGKAVLYTNSVNNEIMLNDLSNLNDFQKSNLTKLNRLLNKSINLHPSMCHYITSLYESSKLSRLLFGDVNENGIKAYSLFL